ncbi:MAG: 4Fe-4S binding protein, partial [Candidatus Methanomethylicia archaeon]
SGCGICVSTCPYNAIKINKERGVAEISSGSCMGCGMCTSACPTRAIIQKHFTDEIINAAINALLGK